MKNILLLFLLMMLCFDLINAQPTQQQTIEESELGWYKVYHFKGTRESKKLNGRLYSAAQLSLCDTLANWMQASYLPKGGIGDVQKTVFPAVNQYSPFDVALPQGYGATAYTWNVSYNAEGKLQRIPETQTGWTVTANEVPGWPIRDLSTETHYYFTMPSFEGREEVKRQQDLSGVANLKPYITFWLKNIEAGNGTEYVLLCKDNKSPFVKLTKGEYLQLLEKGIPGAYEKEKRKIYDKNRGNQKSIDYFMKYLDEKHAKRLACLKSNKEKYQGRLLETAETFAAQPDIMLENYPDVFEGSGANSFKYPVYTLDPALYELCKKDKPQWILLGWFWSPNDAKEKHMHESIINNFNFDYVYNFFFDPEKIKGQPYRPMRSPAFKEAVVATEKSAMGVKASLDKNIHYFEDFSTTVVGKKPVGWYAKTNNTGISSTITTVAGTEEKWAVFSGNALIPNNLTKPLPQNFTFSYDIMVPENFTWGSKGLVVVLAKEKTEGVADSFIRLKLRPGSGSADGEAELETKFPSPYTSGTKWYGASGFSNNKKLNRIHVDIRKNGEVLQLLIDKKMITEYAKGVPADMSFNALSFAMANSGGESDVYYISNIKITKE